MYCVWEGFGSSGGNSGTHKLNFENVVLASIRDDNLPAEFPVSLQCLHEGHVDEAMHAGAYLKTQCCFLNTYRLLLP
jgi:hypothetical protein